MKELIGKRTLKKQAEVVKLVWETWESHDG